MALLRRLSFIMFFIGLIGCGGGDGGFDGGDNAGGSNEPIVVSIEISNNVVTEESPATLTAKVMRGSDPVVDEVVTFSTSGDSTTATTDSDGIATMTLVVGNIAGEGSVTASVASGESATVNYIVEALVEITLSLLPQDTTVSDSTPITVSASVMKGSTPIAGELVSFIINDEELAFFSPENGAVKTNSDGIAEVTLHAGSKEGGGIIQARAIIDTREVTETIAFDSAGDGNTGDETKVQTVSLFASSQQIASSGADQVTLTAIVKDIDNNLIEGATVSFSSTSGSIEHDGSPTGVDGKVTAKLSTEAEPESRIIEITAMSDLISDSVNVQVVGTTVSLTGSSSLAINDSNTYIVNVLDSDGNPIGNEEVSLSLSNQSTESPAGDVAEISLPATVTTDFTGQATVNVTGTTGGTNSIVASALGVSSTRDVAVQADSFLFTLFDNNNGSQVDPSNTLIIPDVLLSKSAAVTLTWTRSGALVPDGTVVNFTTTRGVLVADSGTISNGKVTATVSSTNAGKALVTFSGVDGDIALNNQLEFEFVAETVETVVAQASPSSIGPSGETSTISVVVKDENGNLVKNKTVDFTLTDTNGGSIFPASAVTDSNGSASTVYTSNTVSAENGVSVLASVEGKSDTVTLTVADRELFIALGTGNELLEFDETTYNKKYTVFVTDVDSTPIENATITISAIPTTFHKGVWGHVLDENGDFEVWAAFHSISCANEDLNGDGILDVGEDTNGDTMLTPGNVVSASGEVVTDEQGRAVIDILYPQSFAQWIDIQLIASTKVTGTESSSQATFTLPVSADDVKDEFNTPPVANTNLRSPFGGQANCSNID